MIGFPKYRPIVVGAVGGSGTRVVAKLLITCGVHLGDDLNGAKDNLLAVLFFNRPSVLLDTKEDFRTLLHLFYRRMAGDTRLEPYEAQQLERLAKQPRIQHDPEFLAQRVRSYGNTDSEPLNSVRWGWKMPPNHIFLHRLIEEDPTIRYIHVFRHGLDMAFRETKTNCAPGGR